MKMRFCSLAVTFGIYGLVSVTGVAPALAQNAEQPLVATITVPVKVAYLRLSDPAPTAVSCALYKAGADTRQAAIATGSTPLTLITTDATTDRAASLSFSGSVAVKLFAVPQTGVSVAPGRTVDQQLAANAITAAASYTCTLVMPNLAKTEAAQASGSAAGTAKPVGAPVFNISGGTK